MQRLLLSIGLGLLLHTAAQAESLIVLTSGNTILSTAVTVNNDGSYTYRRTDGEEEQIAASKVYRVLPRVVRGQTYKKETILQTIQAIKATQTKFPKLKKQTNAMLAEWQAMAEQSGEQSGAQSAMAEQVESVIREYRASDRTPQDFNKLRSELSMIRYRDMRGLHQERIDRALEELKSEYMQHNLKRVSEMAANRRPKPEEFRVVDQLVKQLLAQKPTAERAAKISEQRQRARDRCIRFQLDRVRAGFSQKPSINSYLIANDILYALEQMVALPKHLPALKRLRIKMQNALPAFDFQVKGVQGFPIIKDDKQLFGRLGTVTVPGLNADERPAAMLIPTRPLPKISLRTPKKIIVQIIFRRRPPKRLGYTIEPSGLYFTYDKIIVRNAHAKAPVNVDFSKVNDVYVEQLEQRISLQTGNRLSIVLVTWEDDTETDERVYRRISNAMPLELDASM